MNDSPRGNKIIDLMRSTCRGWIQTETQLVQDTAIAHLLSPDGHFFQALLKLSSQPEYCYDLVTDSLPVSRTI